MLQRGRQLFFTDPIEAESFLNTMDDDDAQRATSPLQQHTPRNKKRQEHFTRQIWVTPYKQKYQGKGDTSQAQPGARGALGAA